MVLGINWSFIGWLVEDPDGWNGLNIKDEAPQQIKEEYWAWVKKAKAREEEACSKNEFLEIY